MPLPRILASMGAPVYGSDDATYFVRRIEYVGEVHETRRIRLYASRAPVSRVHGDDTDAIFYVLEEGAGEVLQDAAETARFRRGEKL